MKDIPGFEGRYAITEDGQVWSYPKTWQGGKSNNAKSGHLGKWLTPRKGNDTQAYFSVNLCKGGKPKSYYIHRLVALAYVTNTKNYKIVNHIDGDRSNNNHSNLEWCTQAENLSHSFRTGLSMNYGETHYKRILDWIKVREIRNKYKPFKYTVTMLANEYGVTRGCIQHIIENKTWKENPSWQTK